MAYSPKKHLGQHFLADQAIISRILRMMQIKTDDCIIEIGPGRGALTKGLIEACKDFSCVEFDKDLVHFLSHQYPQLTIFHQDALKFDFSKHAGAKPLRIIGNLPYNISTPILFHILESADCLQDMYLMLQKEVVDRMCAAPGSKTYGRLSVMVQYACQTTHLFDVPDTAFDPPPKVQSAVVLLKPYNESNFPFEKVPIHYLNKVTTTAFSKRRKTLRNSLKGLIEADALQELNLDLSARPETLSVADYVTLANHLQLNQNLLDD